MRPIPSTNTQMLPGTGMVSMVMVLQSVELPAETIAILLLIDHFLDTFKPRSTWKAI